MPEAASTKVRMDKLRAIKFFCRAVEAKSFAAAAVALDVVPSALSKMIAGLEREIGFKLMNRSTRRLSLTDDGLMYYEQSRILLEQIEEIEARGRKGTRQLKGTLRIGMHPGLRYLVLTELGRFLDANVDIKVETDITNSASAVLERGLDAVLHIGTLSNSRLTTRRVGWARALTCASPAYLRAWGVPLHPKDLARHRAVIYGRPDEDSNTTWTFVRGGERCSVDVPVSLVTRDGIGLTDAVLGGCGIARPFDVAVHRLLAAGELKTVLEPWQGTRYAVSVVLPPGTRNPSSKTQAFIEFFSSLLRSPPEP
jgi:LysR family transcriptional regulator for bpeEF and oprC